MIETLFDDNVEFCDAVPLKPTGPAVSVCSFRDWQLAAIARLLKALIFT